MLPFQHVSFWEKETFLSPIDYLVIGSGIVGLSAAIELRQRFPSAHIVVLERGYLPTGASTKNAGFSCFGSPSELMDDLTHISREKVIQTIRLRWEGLMLLQSRIAADCLEFESCGSYDLFTENERHIFNNCVQSIEELNLLVQEAIGLADCFRVAKPNEYNHFSGIIGAIFNQYEGKIHTGKTMKELLRIAQSQGILILNGIHVTQLKPDKRTPSAVTNYGNLNAKKIIVCTNGFSKQLFPDIQLEPARAQVMVTAPIDGLNLPSTYHYDRGYFYFRSVDNNRILIGGARNSDFEGERTTELSCTPFILSKIEALMSNVIIPGKKVEIDYTWAGIMGVGEEKYPIIEEVEPGIIAGVRLGGMGVAMGSAVGKRLADCCG
jgi:gamma-glutamylputrescine oxidase